MLALASLAVQHCAAYLWAVLVRIPRTGRAIEHCMPGPGHLQLVYFISQKLVECGWIVLHLECIMHV